MLVEIRTVKIILIKYQMEREHVIGNWRKCNFYKVSKIWLNCFQDVGGRTWKQWNEIWLKKFLSKILKECECLFWMLVVKCEERNDMKVELFIRKEVDWLTIWKILVYPYWKLRKFVPEQRVHKRCPEFDEEIGRGLTISVEERSY